MTAAIPAGIFSEKADLMVAATYDAAMVRVFADEGGYTNDPVDPGGATNFGITIHDARMYWKEDATPADVRNMPKDVAKDIYKKHYAAPVRYDDLPAGFDYSVFDAGINSGVGRAIPWAGKAIGQPVRNINDVVPLAQIAKDKVSLIQNYWAIRLSFLHGLHTWSHFGPGWGRRCAQGEAAAVKMWLSVGQQLSSVTARKKMDDEAAKAKNKASTSTKVATGTGAGTAATPAIDTAHMTMGGKVALGIGIVAAIVLLIYLIRQAYIHNQRAAAYAAS